MICHLRVADDGVLLYMKRILDVIDSAESRSRRHGEAKTRPGKL